MCYNCPYATKFRALDRTVWLFPIRLTPHRRATVGYVLFPNFPRNFHLFAPPSISWEKTGVVDCSRSVELCLVQIKCRAEEFAVTTRRWEKTSGMEVNEREREGEWERDRPCWRKASISGGCYSEASASEGISTFHGAQAGSFNYLPWDFPRERFHYKTWWRLSGRHNALPPGSTCSNARSVRDRFPDEDADGINPSFNVESILLFPENIQLGIYSCLPRRACDSLKYLARGKLINEFQVINLFARFFARLYLKKRVIGDWGDLVERIKINERRYRVDFYASFHIQLCNFIFSLFEIRRICHLRRF